MNNKKGANMTHINQRTGLAHQPTTKSASTITHSLNSGGHMRKRLLKNCKITPTAADVKNVSTQVLKLILVVHNTRLSPAGKRTIVAEIKSRKTSENQAH